MTIERLQEYGLTEMDDESIEAFLANEGTGVLGLPAEEIPYLLPMSYEFDGESMLYFTFIGGPESRKRQLIESTESAGFLVYDAKTAFNWESVMVTGAVEKVPYGEWERFAAATESPWRPEVFESAMESETVTVYRLRMEEWSGCEHTGLPPGFADDGDAARADNS